MLSIISSKETLKNMRMPEQNPNSSQNTKLQYILSLPFRIAIAGFLLLINFAIVLGFTVHFRDAKVVRKHGEEIKVLVFKKVSPRTNRERQYYFLRSPNGGNFTHKSNAKYPVGESINILYLSRSKVPPSSLAASNILIRGKKSDSLITLYFSSIKDDFSDYGVTHSLLFFILGTLAIKVVLPPKNISK
jgi:hypothetical protein